MKKLLLLLASLAVKLWASLANAREESAPLKIPIDQAAPPVEAPLQGHQQSPRAQGNMETARRGACGQPGPGEYGQDQAENSWPNQKWPVAGARETADPARAEDLRPAARLPPLPGGLSRARAGAAPELHPQRLLENPDAQGGKLLETLDRLAAETRNRQQQTIAMVESLIGHHLACQQAMDGLHQRLAMLEAQAAVRRSTGTSG